MRRAGASVTYVRLAAFVIAANLVTVAASAASGGATASVGVMFGFLVAGVLLAGQGLHSRHPTAAAALVSLVGTGGVIGYSLVRADPAAAILGPIVAYLIILPRVAGRASVAFGGIAVGATITAYVIAFGLDEAVFGLFVAAVILIGVLARQRHEIVALVDRLSGMVEGVPVGIIRIAVDGAVLDANSAAARLLRAAGPAALIGERIHGLEPPHGSGDRPDLATTAQVQQVTALDGSSLTVRHLSRAVRDASGAVSHYQSALEDLTEQHDLQDRIDRWTGEREAVVASLRRIEPEGSIVDVATAFCREITATTGAAYAGIAVATADGALSRIAATMDRRPLDPSVFEIPMDRARALRAGDAAGPWIERVADANDGPWRDALQAHGVRWLSHVSIESQDRVAGHLTVGSAALREDEVLRRLPDVREYATVAGALLGPMLVSRFDDDAQREQIQGIITNQAFRPVFQTIVDLRTGTVLGFEALTRFSDWTDPAAAFAEAERVGLGLELEVATLEAALHASGPLPANAFLDLNVSPALILENGHLTRLIRGSGWNVVLEVTEHVAIDDYGLLRQAIERLGPTVRLAVDDAGAGYASLRHIRELKPEFVKLDRDLVDGIDRDLTRQAIVTGMHHFSRLAGCVLVAEGVETEGERQTLLDLGVPLGQGYLFAAPAPATALVRAAAS